MTPHDVVCISSIDWDFIWQGHQEIMSRLAASGHRVLFIENTGVRPPRIGDLPRVVSRLRNWRRGTKGQALNQRAELAATVAAKASAVLAAVGDADAELGCLRSHFPLRARQEGGDFRRRIANGGADLEVGDVLAGPYFFVVRGRSRHVPPHQTAKD